MHSTRYCKCHFIEGESEHWGVLERKAFALKGAKPHFTPDMPLLPIHLKLELNFDWDEERVWGVTTHHLKVKGHDVREICFDAVNLDITQVRLGRNPVQFENTGEQVLIRLPQKLKPGGDVSIQLTHSVTKPVAGIYFTKPDAHYPNRFKTVWTQGQDEDSRYYFPCLDKPNFKQTTEVLLNLPPGMFGLSNGRLLAKKNGPAGAFFHYKLEIPYSTYLLSIVAGEFSKGKDQWEDVDILWYVQKGREKEGHNSFKDTADIVRFFSEYTGYRYPYSHYTQIAAPEFIFGGMENFTVTTQTDLTLHDDRARLDIDSNGLVAHEAAHTWFGDLVTAKSWSHAWLHESFATYFDALYTRESKGEAEFHYQMLEDAETYFSEDNKYRRPIVTHIYKEPIDLFDAHLYPGGAVRLHHLKSIVGEKHFREALGIYLKRHEFGLVETVDFIRCIEEVTARNYDEWLSQWIYRGGYPVLEVGFKWEDKFNMAVVDIKQAQTADKKDEELLFKLPLKVAFHHARTEEVFPLEINNREERFCFRLKSKPLFFRIDPEYECPCKKVKLDVSRPMLYEQLKRDPDPIGRIDAAAALIAKSSTKDVEVLSQRLLAEKFWGVAVRIAAALGKIGGDQAREGLVKALKISNPRIRYGVVNALGQFVRDEKAFSAVEKVVAGDRSYRVEAVGFQALGRIKDKRARAILEKSIDCVSHNDMAQSAIYNALSELAEEDSWDCLVRGAEYGARKSSRVAAMRAMATLARRYPHRKAEAIEHFSRFAKETRGTPAAVFRGKLGAITALQNLDDLDAIPTLRYLAANEVDGRLRRRAEEAISALFDSSRKPEEIKGMRSELDDVVKENKSLRDRLSLVEKKEEANNKKKKG